MNQLWSRQDWHNLAANKINCGLAKTASLRFAWLSSSRIELTQTHRNNLRSLQGLFMLICFNKLACSASSQK
jgi:hypothetical protein